MSMAFNAQPTYSIDRDLLCVSFITIWLKRRNLRRDLLCHSSAMKFTEGEFKATRYRPWIHNMMLLKFYSYFIVYDLFISYYFLLSFLKLKFWGIVGCIIDFGGKTWVSFYLPLIFSLTLDRLKKFEWYIPTLSKPIVMNVRPWATSPHAYTRTEPNRFGPGSGPGGSHRHRLWISS